MKGRDNRERWMALFLVALAAAAQVQPLDAQSTKMGSTLRYGSGFFNVPAASTLPHLAITGTYSGFGISVDERVFISQRGIEKGRLPGEWSQWLQDASVAIGLFDRLEVGASFQNFADAESGGNMVGAFGRVALVKPESSGFGLAVGTRFVSGPSFGDGRDHIPPRLGFPDIRFYDHYEGGLVDDMSTSFSPYAMATFQLAGLDSDALPEHDLTFGLGYGTGMFGGSGSDLGWYGRRYSHGWLAATALHVQLSRGVLLNLMGEYDGWDVNTGLQLDVGGIRAGAYVLGIQHVENSTIYRSSRFGVMASLALCPNGSGLLCSPELMPRPEPIQLPAPPPDTVVIERTTEIPIELSAERTLCLATGENGTVMATPEGAEVIALDALGGVYAADAEWFNNDSEIEHGDYPYEKVGEQISPNCTTITRVGEWLGVPLFAESAAAGADPIPMIYVPVTPGRWQPYELPARVRG